MNVIPGILISTAYYYYNLLLLSKIAGILGKKADQKKYGHIAESTREAFNRRFFNSETAQYATGSQGSNAMPLFLDLVPAEKRQNLLNNIVRDIMEIHKGHLNTGNQCTKYMAEALTKLGKADVVYTFVTQITYPSWGFMLQRGATTIWERWEELSSGGMNSHCHPMLGSIGAWFYKYLAGIQPDVENPGWGLIQIKPFPVGDLTAVKASVETLRGTISVKWRRNSECFSLEVAVPTNSEAYVMIPLLGWSEARICESGKAVWQDYTFRLGVPGIHSGRLDDGYVLFKVGSGIYKFELQS
jgi:alpha-L-rhamnosidase